MDFIGELLAQVVRSLSISEEESKRIETCLRYNWLDSPNSLRSVEATTLMRLGISEKTSEAIVFEIQKNRTEKMQEKPFEIVSGKTRSSSGDCLRERSLNNLKKRVKRSSDESTVDVNSSGDFRDKVSECLDSFVGYESNQEVRNECLSYVGGILENISESIENTSHRSIETRKPDNYRNIFQYTDLCNLFLFLGFEFEKETRIFLKLKLSLAAEIKSALEIVNGYIVVENKSIEITSQKEENEDIIVIEDSDSFEVLMEVERDIMDENLRNILNVLENKHCFRFDPELKLVSAFDKKIYSLEINKIPANFSELQTDFEKLKSQFSDTKKWMEENKIEVNQEMKLKLEKMEMIFGGLKVELTLKVSGKEYLVMRIARFEKLQKVFDLITTHLRNSWQHFYLFNVQNNQRYLNGEDRLQELLGNSWKENALTLSLIFDQQENCGSKLFRVESKTTKV